jgi:hypothetical protein
MKRQPVTSSNVKSVGYDDFKHLLEVEFSNGDVYQYIGVPENTYVAFMQAPSIGKAVHEMLRGKFKYQKV